MARLSLRLLCFQVAQYTFHLTSMHPKLSEKDSGHWSVLVCLLFFSPRLSSLQPLCSRALTLPILPAQAQAMQSSILRSIFRFPTRFSLIFFSSSFLVTPVAGALLIRQRWSNPTMS